MSQSQLIGNPNIQTQMT